MKSTVQPAYFTLELKSRIDLEAGHKSDSIAHQYQKDGLYDNYLENKLYSLKYYTDYYMFTINSSPDMKDFFISEQASSLKRLYNFIKDKSVEGASLYSTRMNINQIRILNDRSIDNYLDLISAKFVKDNESRLNGN